MRVIPTVCQWAPVWRGTVPRVLVVVVLLEVDVAGLVVVDLLEVVLEEEWEEDVVRVEVQVVEGAEAVVVVVVVVAVVGAVLRRGL